MVTYLKLTKWIEAFFGGISSCESQYAVCICLTRESSLTLLAMSLAALKFFCWSNTFAELLWPTWLMWRTSADLWKFLHQLVNAFFFPAFVQSLQIIDKSSPEPLVCSHPNSFSHLSKNWLCLPPFSRFIVATWPIKQQTNMGRSSFKFPGCVNRLQSPLCS